MPTVSYKCVTCGAAAIYSCQFELMGSKRGQTCGRSLCKSHHVRLSSGKILCLTHSRFTQQRVVAVKEAERITFVVPPERQLPASSAVALSQPKPKKQRARKGTAEALADLKYLVRELTGEPPTTLAFKAGVVMLAPMRSSFDVTDIMAFTSYQRPIVEKCVGNLLRYRVWADECWRCLWAEMFTGKELTDDELFAHAVAFSCDAMVATGELSRTERDGEYYWQVLK